MEFSRVKASTGHTHAMSALDRTLASTFIDRLGPSVGMRSYFVQRSRTDERKNRAGSRVPFWSKDLNAELEDFAPQHDDLLAFVDVDQYIDMPSFLCDNFQSTVLYTFQPTQVARTATEYSFTFDEDNSVDYRVTGGGRYQHRVWNYSHDNILVYKSFFGIPYKAATYGIDRRRTSEDHELVLLTPLSMWRGFFAFIVRFFLFGRALTRLRVVFGRFLRLKVHSGAGLLVSTGKIGEFAQATVPIEIDETLGSIAKISKFDLTLPQSISACDGNKEAGTVLTDYHRNSTNDAILAGWTRESLKPDVVAPIPESVRVYSFDPSTYDPADKPIMTPYMSPILGDCFVPANSLSNIQNGVTERIEKVKPGELAMTPFLFQCMQEFVEFLIPEPNVLDPEDDDYLYVHQFSPSQRRILETPTLEPKRVANCFVKKESYGDVKPMRLISQINGDDKAEYSKFIYAFTAHVLKHQEWYAFGKTPKEVAERVAQVCALALKDVSNSDFSKFDGHGSNLMRELERLVLMRAFRKVHLEKVIGLHRTQFGLKAFVRTPDVLDPVVTYDSEFARLSGSPETSSFNGVTNAFVSYLQARLSRPDGTCKTPAQAWKDLGIYGGDDGLTADVDTQNYKRAAKMIGQAITVEKVQKHCLGVKFLARVYSPFVWVGDVNTCCDLPRQLTKIHVTVNLGHGVTPIMKLLEKCLAYWLTDANTPILGEFVKRARYLLNGEFERNPLTAPMRAWSAKFDKCVQYKNEPAEWMMEYVEQVMPSANIHGFFAWLEKTTILSDLLKPPLLQEPVPAKPKVPVVVDGQIVEPDAPAKDNKKPQLPKSDKPEKPKMTKEEFETFKADLVAKGRWREKTVTPPQHADDSKDWKKDKFVGKGKTEKPPIKGWKARPRANSADQSAKPKGTAPSNRG
jgi:hypothetical protein